MRIGNSLLSIFDIPGTWVSHLRRNGNSYVTKLKVRYLVASYFLLGNVYVPTVLAIHHKSLLYACTNIFLTWKRTNECLAFGLWCDSRNSCSSLFVASNLASTRSHYLARSPKTGAFKSRAQRRTSRNYRACMCFLVLLVAQKYTTSSTYVS